MSTWQINDIKTVLDLMHDFEDTIGERSATFLGIHPEGEGPRGVQPTGTEPPIIFATYIDGDPEIEIRAANRRRGRRQTIRLTWWSEPAKIVAVFIDYAQRWLTHLDTASITGWTLFPEEATEEPGIEQNFGMAGKTIATPCFAGGA